MKILFLTNLPPWPLDNGGKIKSHTTLEALHQAGIAVDLFCFCEQPDLQQDLGDLPVLCRSIHQVFQPLTTANFKAYMIKQAVLSLASRDSFGLHKYRSRTLEKLLTAQKETYDLIWLDHLQMALYQPLLKQKWPQAAILLDEHNNETLIMQRKKETEQRLPLRLFLSLEVWKLRRFEAWALQQADHVFVLSLQDLRALEQLAGGPFPSTIIPIGVQDPGMRRLDIEEQPETTAPDPGQTPIEDGGCRPISLLYVGTLTWGPNDEGLQWFLREVLPLMNAQGIPYTFDVAGKHPSRSLQDLAAGDPQVHLLGYVSDLTPYYALADALVVPLFVGSGQRVKIIEAYAAGVPVVTTTIGAEGLRYDNGQSLWIADTPAEFVEALQDLRAPERRRHLALEGRRIYEQEYSTQSSARRICAALLDTGFNG